MPLFCQLLSVFKDQSPGTLHPGVMLNFTILFACLSMGFTSFLAILTKRDPGTVRLKGLTTWGISA
jgi:hypothetical protein